MRRLALSLLFGLGCFCLFAESVSREEIHRQAVSACMRIAEEDFSTKAYTITPMLEEGDTCYYVVQFEPEGFALIAADDRVQPIIGYSITDRFQLEKAPEPMSLWMKNRASEIKQTKSSLRNAQRHSGWQTNLLRSGNQTEKIPWLIKVSWDQDSPYNKYCPINRYGIRTLVGCGAVAMGQAMTVFQHPTRPKGYIGYNVEDVGSIIVDFDKEPSYNWEKIISGTDNNDEAARFLYHCAVSLSTSFGNFSSRSYLHVVLEALVNTFSYVPDSLIYYDSNYNTSNESLTKIILKELKQGRPVIYYIGYSPSSGHLFNIDGYDGVDAFHFNYGWGSFSNVYYTLDYALDKSNVRHRGRDRLIVGLVPDTRSSTDIESVAQSLETPLQVVGSLLRLKSPEKGVCRVYDLSGALLQTAPVVAGDNEILLNTKGLCILSVDCNGKVASHKIHVKE